YVSCPVGFGSIHRRDLEGLREPAEHSDQVHSSRGQGSSQRHARVVSHEYHPGHALPGPGRACALDGLRAGISLGLRSPHHEADAKMRGCISGTHPEFLNFRIRGASPKYTLYLVMPAARRASSKLSRSPAKSGLIRRVSLNSATASANLPASS